MKMLRSSPLILIILLLFSCNREDIINKEPAGYKPVDIKYLLRSSISGYVYDQEGQPVEKAEIKLGGKSYYSENDGFFEISNVPMDKEGEIIQVNAQNHFTQYAVVTPRLQKPAMINIVQQKKSGGININPAVKSTKSFYNSTLICDIPANNFIAKDGSPYSKKIKMYLKSPFLTNFWHLTNPLFGAPVCRKGLDDAGGEVLVTPVFTTFAAFETQEGEPLHLKEKITVKATITYTVFTGGEKFFLWKFDTDAGIWQSVVPVSFNTAGNFFTFAIDSGGYYAIAKKGVQACTLAGTVKFYEGSPAVFTPFEIVNMKNNLSVTGNMYTDASGNFSVKLEKGGFYLMQFTGCDNTTFYHPLGEINSSTNKEISLPSDFNNISTLHIENIYNENGGIVKKGFAGLSSLNYYNYIPVYADSNGADIRIHDCNPVMVLYDLDNLPQIKKSKKIFLKETVNVNPRDFPAIYEDTNYVYAEIEGFEPVFDSHPCAFECQDINGTTIYNSDNTINICIYKDAGEKQYTGIIFFSKYVDGELIFYQSSETEPVEFDVVKEGNIMRASFSGSLYGEAGEIKAIEGYFKIDLQ